MKKLISVTVLLTFLTAPMFAQSSAESDYEPPLSSIVPEASQMVLYDGFGAFGFSFSDGSALKYGSLKETLSLVSENEKFIRRADTWNVLFYIFIGSAFGLTGGAMYLDNTGNREIANILFGSASCSIMLSFCSERMFNRNINKAIGNYNLAVMGVPAIYR